MNDPWTVSLSVRLYRVLLGAYPQPFRAAYGAEMAQVFRDLCLRPRRGGLAGVWLRALLDFITSLVSEYMERGVTMTRSKWIQLSGWGLAASGFVLMAGLAASDRPTYHPNNAAAWAIDPLLNIAARPLSVLGLVLLSAGLAGLLARFSARAGGLGRAGLGLGMIASLASAGGAIGLGFSDSSPWWDIFIVGFLALNLGLVLFGAECLRLRLFARWNALPLAAGVVILAFLLASMGFNGEAWPVWLVAAAFMAYALGLGLVGFRLLSESGEVLAV